MRIKDLGFGFFVALIVPVTLFGFIGPQFISPTFYGDGHFSRWIHLLGRDSLFDTKGFYRMDFASRSLKNDRPDVWSHYIQSAAKSGAKDAERFVWRAYQFEGDNENARKSLINSALQGNVESQMFLGMAYLSGAENLKIEKSEAQGVELLKKASEAGQPDAMYCLASAYDRGLGVVANEREAINIYMQAQKGGTGKGLSIDDLRSEKIKSSVCITPVLNSNKEYVPVQYNAEYGKMTVAMPVFNNFLAYEEIKTAYLK